MLALSALYVPAAYPEWIAAVSPGIKGALLTIIVPAGIVNRSVAWALSKTGMACLGGLKRKGADQMIDPEFRMATKWIEALRVTDERKFFVHWLVQVIRAAPQYPLEAHGVHDPALAIIMNHYPAEPDCRAEAQDSRPNLDGSPSLIAMGTW